MLGIRKLQLVFVATFIAIFASGCGQKAKPISMEAARGIKSGTPLDEIVKVLGEPQSPSTPQSQHLANIIAGMPEPMRSNAEKDRSVAWGNDSAFLVAKVNDKNVVWVTGWKN